MASMKKGIVLLLLQIALVAAVVSGFHLDVDVEVDPRGRCRQVDLRPCHDAVEEGSSHPSRECCMRFQQIQDDECMCEAIVSDRLLGESKYLDMALRLPEECGLSAPRGRECERRRSSYPFLHLSTKEREWELEPCYEAVEGGGRQPSQACCEKLRRIPREERCEAIREDERLGEDREMREEAMRLPERCGLQRCDRGSRRMAFPF